MLSRPPILSYDGYALFNWKRFDPTGPIALGNIARARGMSQLARKTGLTREGLYKALSPGGNPEFGTVMKVIRALGLELRGATAKG